MDHVSAQLCIRLLERLDPFRTWWILVVHAVLIVAVSAAASMLLATEPAEFAAFEAMLSVAAVGAACLAFLPTIVRTLMEVAWRAPSEIELSATFTDELRPTYVRRFAAQEMARRKTEAGANAWASEWKNRADAL